MEHNSNHWSRSSSKLIAGVCAGIAQQLKVDPVFVRVFFVFLVLFGGSGLLIYIILWIALPLEPYPYYEAHAAKPLDADNQPATTTSQTVIKEGKTTAASTKLFIGLAFIGFGLFFLADTLFPQLDIQHFWPVILIVIGIMILWPAKQMQ